MKKGGKCLFRVKGSFCYSFRPSTAMTINSDQARQAGTRSDEGVHHTGYITDDVDAAFASEDNLYDN